MYSDSEKKIPLWVMPVVLILVLIIAISAFAAGGFDRKLNEEGAAAIEDAVRRSALQCYAVEGVYPPDLAYLEENYGLQVNKKDYYITYDAFASNVAPDVIVQVKGERRR
ncbi:MAG: hypothetical protein E7240_10525 [Lachnospiraceae bacterium]|nr:hypothetical protein [Lachnospiraceae bacterium]